MESSPMVYPSVRGTFLCRGSPRITHTIINVVKSNPLKVDITPPPWFRISLMKAVKRRN